MVDAIGKNSVIHGYNPQLQCGQPDRYSAFKLNRRKTPESFNNEQVLGTQFYDHQSHIIPQNIYAVRMNEIADRVDKKFLGTPDYTLDAVIRFFDAEYLDLKFGNVSKYIVDTLMSAGNAVETEFVNPSEKTIEERIGGYFSVINWNPVNICRAPGDDHRAGYPGNSPDCKVAAKLLASPEAPGITLLDPYGTFLTDHIGDPAAHVDAFIAACNRCLPKMPGGLYRFTWVDGGERDGYVPAK